MKGMRSVLPPQHMLQELARNMEQPGGGAAVAGAPGQRFFQHGAPHQLFDALHGLVPDQAPHVWRYVGRHGSRGVDGAFDGLAIERFAHERTHAALSQLKCLLGPRGSADADHERLGADRVELVDEVECRAVRQREVEHDQIWSLLSNRRASLPERLTGADSRPELDEKLAELPRQLPAIVDDEYVPEPRI